MTRLSYLLGKVMMHLFENLGQLTLIVPAPS